MATPAPTCAPPMAPTMISTTAPKMAPTVAGGASCTHPPNMSPTSEESRGDTIGFMMRVHLRVWRRWCGLLRGDSVGLQELAEKYADWLLHANSSQLIHLNLLFERARQQGVDMDGLVADLLRNVCSRAWRNDGILLSPSSVTWSQPHVYHECWPASKATVCLEGERTLHTPGNSRLLLSLQQHPLRGPLSFHLDQRAPAKCIRIRYNRSSENCSSMNLRDGVHQKLADVLLTRKNITQLIQRRLQICICNC